MYQAGLRGWHGNGGTQKQWAAPHRRYTPLIVISSADKEFILFLVQETFMRQAQTLDVYAVLQNDWWFFMLYLMKHLKEWGKEKQHQAPSDSAVSHTSWQQVDQLFVLLNPGDGCLTRVSVLSLDRKWPNVQRKHRDDADDFLRKHCVSWPDEQHSR